MQTQYQHLGVCLPHNIRYDIYLYYGIHTSLQLPTHCEYILKYFLVTFFTYSIMCAQFSYPQCRCKCHSVMGVVLKTTFQQNPNLSFQAAAMYLD